MGYTEPYDMVALHSMVDLSRRALLVSGAIVTLQGCSDLDKLQDESIEEMLIDKLTSRSTYDRNIDHLIQALEERGGSQRALAEGPGSFETPWIGAWNVMYTNTSQQYPSSLKDAQTGQEFRLM